MKMPPMVHHSSLLCPHNSYAVHATYQFEDAADCAFGKRERMREWGMWKVDDDMETDNAVHLYL